MCGMANWGNAAALTYAGAVKPCETLPCAAPGLSLRADGAARALARARFRDAAACWRLATLPAGRAPSRPAPSPAPAIAAMSGACGRAPAARSQSGRDQAAYSAAAALA
jgi:hypothetical protein